MNIRKLTAGDYAAFRDIRMEMCASHPGAFGQTPEEVAAMTIERYRDWAEPSEVFPQKYVLAAFESERLLATVGFRREDSAKEKHRGWIWTVYVRPEARGQGISKRLMMQILADARTMEGLEMLTLTVAVTQTSARTLYTALGFFTNGLNLHGYKFADGSYVDHEEMTLWL